MSRLDSDKKATHEETFPYIRLYPRLTNDTVKFYLTKFKEYPWASAPLIQRVIKKGKRIEHPFYKSVVVGKIDEHWSHIIYETKELKLMNSGYKYNEIWDPDTIDEHRNMYTNNRSRKLATYILEISYPLRPPYEKISVESILYTIPKKGQKGRFVVCYEQFRQKQIFNTNMSESKHLFVRQPSGGMANKFYCSCRESDVEDISLMFIIYPKSTTLALPRLIDMKWYRILLKMPNVLLFKQEKAIEF